MKLCIVGKYPPIEGGVSSSTYWLARSLAQRGHEIHVVTNAAEVEDTYRMRLSDGDAEWLEPRFPATGGAVIVHNTGAYAAGIHAYIPAANPFVSKIAALCTDVVRAHGCQAILAYYYEPYGVGAWLAARWTGVPLLVKHAGSDLDRLFAFPALATTYRELLRSADAVITRYDLMPRFLQMGVPAGRLCQSPPHSIPGLVFNPEGDRLDFAAYALDGGAKGIDGRGPVIGIYGKVGLAKGTFDLIASLGLLAAKGLPFMLAAMVGEGQFKRLVPALRDAQILSRSIGLPFLPNWRVPAFIRACTAVAFLERDFPIAIHGPMIPREILACGTGLIVSAEIAKKQFFRDKIESGANAWVVNKPQDHAELADVLHAALGDGERAAQVGQAGNTVFRSVHGEIDGIEDWEKLLGGYIHEDGSAGSRSRDAISGPDALLDGDLTRTLDACCPALLAGAAKDEKDPLRAAIDFCDHVLARLDEDVTRHAGKLREGVRFQRLAILNGIGPTAGTPPVFSSGDVLNGQLLTAELATSLKPLRSNSIQIETFAYDVTRLFDGGASAVLGTDAVDGILDSLPEEQTTFMFLQLPNSATRRVRIDGNTLDLLKRCDGTQTISEIIQDLRLSLGIPAAVEGSDSFAATILEAMQRLYRLKAVVFSTDRTGARRGILWNNGIATALSTAVNESLVAL